MEAPTPEGTRIATSANPECTSTFVKPAAAGRVSSVPLMPVLRTISVARSPDRSRMHLLAPVARSSARVTNGLSSTSQSNGRRGPRHETGSINARQAPPTARTTTSTCSPSRRTSISACPPKSPVNSRFGSLPGRTVSCPAPCSKRMRAREAFSSGTAPARVTVVCIIFPPRLSLKYRSFPQLPHRNCSQSFDLARDHLRDCRRLHVFLSGRDRVGAPETNGQHHDPEQVTEDVDALLNSQPRRRQVCRDPASILSGQEAEHEEDQDRPDRVEAEPSAKGKRPEPDNEENEENVPTRQNKVQGVGLRCPARCQRLAL